MKCFILMADIIGSGNYDARDLMNQLKKIVDSINIIHNEVLLSPLTITLGDEFQAILPSLKDSINIIIKIEEEIIGTEASFKLRYVLHQGEVETDVNSVQAYEMLGSGLTNTRALLDGMKKNSSRFLFKIDGWRMSDRLNQLFQIFQFFIDRWAHRDYKIVDAFLRKFTYKEVAKMCNKDDSTLWRKRKSLAIDQYCTAKKLIITELRIEE